MSIERSIRNAFEGIGDFQYSGEMKNIGAHVIINNFGVFEYGFSINYAWKNREIKNNGDLQYSIIALSGDKDYTILYIFSPYVGVGLGGFHIAQSLNNNSEDPVVEIPFDDETNEAWALKGGVGLNIPKFPMRAFHEWRYANIKTSDEPAKYQAVILGGTLKFK